MSSIEVTFDDLVSDVRSRWLPWRDDLDSVADALERLAAVDRAAFSIIPGAEKVLEAVRHASTELADYTGAGRRAFTAVAGTLVAAARDYTEGEQANLATCADLEARL